MFPFKCNGQSCPVMLIYMKKNNYSNESFDRITHMAIIIANDARSLGRKTPEYGYSQEDWDTAKSIYYCRSSLDVY